MHVNTKFREAGVGSSDADVGDEIDATEIMRIAGIIVKRSRMHRIFRILAADTLKLATKICISEREHTSDANGRGTGLTSRTVTILR